jgi:hypothetical protein
MKLRKLKLDKLKLRTFDVTPLSGAEMQKILGGFVAATTGVASSSTGPSSSVSVTNGTDTDNHLDNDAESDRSVTEEEFALWY